MTARIPNSTPPVETTKADALGPERPVTTGPSETPQDGAQVSDLSRAVAAALGSNEQKVNALRQEVATGVYVVDPVKTIEKMLQIENAE